MTPAEQFLESLRNAADALNSHSAVLQMRLSEMPVAGQVLSTVTRGLEAYIGGITRRVSLPVWANRHTIYGMDDLAGPTPWNFKLWLNESLVYDDFTNGATITRTIDPNSPIIMVGTPAVKAQVYAIADQISFIDLGGASGIAFWILSEKCWK